MVNADWDSISSLFLMSLFTPRTSFYYRQVITGEIKNTGNEKKPGYIKVWGSSTAMTFKKKKKKSE